MAEKYWCSVLNTLSGTQIPNFQPLKEMASINAPSHEISPWLHVGFIITALYWMEANEGQKYLRHFVQ